MSLSQAEIDAAQRQLDRDALLAQLAAQPVTRIRRWSRSATGRDSSTVTILLHADGRWELG